MFNLHLAFPDWSDAQRRKVVRGMIRQIGWMAGEFSQFPKYTRENIERIVLLDGFENFDAARRRGKGVLFLTGHMSAWELAPFAQALYGHPLHFLVRPIANRRVDALINAYRCLSGNRPIEKNRSARAILKVLADGGTVGILADHNTIARRRRVRRFFRDPRIHDFGTCADRAAHGCGRGARISCPGTGSRRKYRLRFEPAVELARTGDEEADVQGNTRSDSCA